MDNPRSAIVSNGKIEIAFPFDISVVETVRGIAGRRWDKGNRLWTVPNTPWHCDRVSESLMPLGFYIDPQILKAADRKAPAPRRDYPAGLYPFQRAGVDFFYDVGGRAILADGMGLGKTITALAFVWAFCGRLLVVAPASVVYKWEAECQRWLPGKTVQVVTNGRDEMEPRDVTILSYAMMVRHYDKLNNMPFDVVIYDECHMLKGRKSQRGRVGRALVKGGIPKVLMLSGTPFLNHPGELFPLLNMLDPVGFDNFFAYATRYMGAEYTGGAWYFPPGVVTNRDELASRLNRIMLRRTDQEVMKDLPPMTRTLIPVELGNKAAYQRAVRDVREWLKDKDRTVLNPKHALTRLNVLRQIVGDGKVDAAVELAESVLQDDEKVVVFAYHEAVVTSLVEALKKYGVRKIVGSVGQKERQKSIDKFQNGNVRVMVISTAGGMGIDLYAAYKMIFVERLWTSAEEEQAEKRLHRIGQTRPVSIYYLYARGTVDEKMARLVDEKRKVIGQVIAQDEIVTRILSEL